MVTRLIVPLDQSQLAESALPLARTLASRWEAPVTLLGVPDLPRGFGAAEPAASAGSPAMSAGGPTSGTPADVPHSFTGHEHTSPGRQPSSKELEQLADATVAYEYYLQTIAATFGETPVETLVRPGEAGERILAVAQQREDPVIVMASHGRSGLTRAVVGSVTAVVVQAAGCPVFVVRGREEQPVDQDEWPLETILVPLDGSDFAEQALATVRRLFGTTVGHLHLVRLVESAPNEAATAYLERTASRLSHFAKQVTWELGEGDVPDEVARVAGKVDAHLIAMATHGRSGVKRLVLGSVAERVLHDADRPLLLVHPPEDRTRPGGH